MRTLYILWQCLWGAVQSALGALLFLVNLRKKHYLHHGAVVTEWSCGGSVSLGEFIFICEKGDTEHKSRLLAHEYGHTIQSLFLGPLYLVVVGLPSVIWAGAFGGYRARKKRSYYSFYTETWANRLEKRFIGDDTPQ